MPYNGIVLFHFFRSSPKEETTQILASRGKQYNKLYSAGLISKDNIPDK